MQQRLTAHPIPYAKTPLSAPGGYSASQILLDTSYIARLHLSSPRTSSQSAPGFREYPDRSLGLVAPSIRRWWRFGLIGNAMQGRKAPHGFFCWPVFTNLLIRILLPNPFSHRFECVCARSCRAPSSTAPSRGSGNKGAAKPCRGQVAAKIGRSPRSAHVRRQHSYLTLPAKSCFSILAFRGVESRWSASADAPPAVCAVGGFQAYDFSLKHLSSFRTPTPRLHHCPAHVKYACLLAYTTRIMRRATPLCGVRSFRTGTNCRRLSHRSHDNNQLPGEHPNVSRYTLQAPRADHIPNRSIYGRLLNPSLQERRTIYATTSKLCESLGTKTAHTYSQSFS